MTRSALFAALALGLAGTANAQTTPAERPVLPADSVAIDSLAADSSSTAIEPSEERARELYREGLDLYRADNLEESLLKYEEALLYGESYAPAGLGRAQVLTRLGRLEDARNAFESAVAMAETSDAANASDIQTAARRGLDQVTEAITARSAAAEAAQQNEAAAATADKVEQATQMLSGNEITMAQATDAYALLEQARMDGYDPDLVAFYYAKALNAMDRGADAVPYAETALAASEGQADRSAFYIQLGLAQMDAGNPDAARAAFGSITEGQAWHGWAQHYIGQLDAEPGAEG